MTSEKESDKNKILGEFNLLKWPARVKKIEVMESVQPHPYCITPKHLEYNDSMYLGAEQIRKAEERGAVCDICKKIHREDPSKPILKWDEHKKLKAILLKLSGFESRSQLTGEALEKVPGLKEFLLESKKIAEKYKVDGFAFDAYNIGGKDK